MDGGNKVMGNGSIWVLGVVDVLIIVLNYWSYGGLEFIEFVVDWSLIF